jgi:hypothetical protein
MIASGDLKLFFFSFSHTSKAFELQALQSERVRHFPLGNSTLKISPQIAKNAQRKEGGLKDDKQTTIFIKGDTVATTFFWKLWWPRVSPLV